jgi:hypothetical protein
MGRWDDMKEPELLEDYAARLTQEKEDQPLGLSGGGQPLRIAQPVAARQGPFTQLPQKPEAGEFGSGYYTYGTDETDRPGTKANGQYGDPRVMQVITSVAGQLADGPVEIPFGVGNISLQDGGRFPPHREHRDGLGIDVRPPRIDKEERPVDFRHPQYDQAGTQRLADAIRVTGAAEMIYFNGPGIKGVTPDKPGVKTHDNHLHIKVKPWRGTP